MVESVVQNKKTTTPKGICLNDKDYMNSILSSLKEMSKNYNKTLGQIALNWSISQGVIVIPRTSSTERMKENLLSTSFKMKDEDIEKIGQLNRNFHFCSSLNWKSFNGIDVFA